MSDPLQAIPPFWMVVPAAGKGARMAADVPKQYLTLCGKTIIEHTLERLLELPELQGIILLLSPDDTFGRELPVVQHEKIHVANGGVERCDSVLNGLASLPGTMSSLSWVLVHDAARPCVAIDDIKRMLVALKDHPVGGVLGVPVSDTLKRVDLNGVIESTVDRSVLWQAQTPQMFRVGALTEALSNALLSGETITDEASAIESSGLHPQMVEGRRDNIKVTRPEDLMMAELILQTQS